MGFLRSLLLAISAVIYIYSFFVVSREGLGLIPVYFGDLFAVTWRGQFNLDFGCYLMLSGLWLAWRSGFSIGGIVRGLLASTLGMLFFAPQLLVLIAQNRNDVHALLLGIHHPK